MTAQRIRHAAEIIAEGVVLVAMFALIVATLYAMSEPVR